MSGIARSRLAEERKGELSILAWTSSLYLPAPPGRFITRESPSAQRSITFCFFFSSLTRPLRSPSTCTPSPHLQFGARIALTASSLAPKRRKTGKVTPAYSPSSRRRNSVYLLSLYAQTSGRARARRRGKGGLLKQTKGSFACVPTRWLEEVVFSFFFP